MNAATPLYDAMVADYGFDPLANLAPGDAAPGPSPGASPEFPAEDLDAAPEAAATGSGAADPSTAA